MSFNRGLIGPGRLFSKGTLYHPQVYAAIAGALVPIPLWLWVRKWPRSVFRNVNTPVIINAGFAMPPATGVNYASFLVIGFIFQFVIRRRNFAWWSKVSRPQFTTILYELRLTSDPVQLRAIFRTRCRHRPRRNLHLFGVGSPWCIAELVGKYSLPEQ